MEIDPSEIRRSEFYQQMIRVIVPRPIAWVSTQSPDGVANVAPFSYFTGVGSNPPSVLFCPANRRDGSRKDTLRNIEQTGEFVINSVPLSLAEPMNASAGDFPEDESEFDVCGLTPSAGAVVSVPRVEESPIQIECRLLQSLHLGTGPGGANVVIGQVVWMHIDESVLDEQGLVDSHQLQAIGRMGGTSYCRTSDTFDLPRP